MSWNWRWPSRTGTVTAVDSGLAAINTRVLSVFRKATDSTPRTGDGLATRTAPGATKRLACASAGYSSLRRYLQRDRSSGRRAVVAAAAVRAMCGVEREIPGAARRAQLRVVPPINVRTFHRKLSFHRGAQSPPEHSVKNVFGRMRGMHRRLQGNVPAVTVPRDAADEACRIRVGHGRERGVRPVPVVVPLEQPRRRNPGESRSGMRLRNQLGKRRGDNAPG
ncbi:MAG: hypothetical protein U0163_14465 [Gemmatimonadaceae bacterium]